MNQSLPVAEIKHQVLWRVGRNVFGFQQLESTLRSVLPTLSGSGTEVEISKQIEEQKKQAEKAGLGMLMTLFEMHVLRPAAAVKDPEKLEEPVFSFSSTIEAHPDNPEPLTALISRWKTLVNERNLLVHSGLLDCDLESHDSCMRLSEKLDDQYERICTIRIEIDNILKSRVRGLNFLQQFFESQEFERFMDSATAATEPSLRPKPN
ncbi:MAG: hypothetical protein IPO13_00900 [Rhodocyclaceae bacterium]|nr:hypothetical protein [Rhodocyclaceae bacterium]